MVKAKGNRRRQGLQPETVTLQPGQKPRDDFPLTAHRASGQWCKKIRGKIYYFGKLDNPDAAETAFKIKLKEIETGVVARPVEVETGRVDVGFACNAFLESKRLRVESGEIAERTWNELRDTCQILIKAFGRDRLVSDLRGSDFDSLRSQLAKRLGPVRLTNEVGRVKAVFRYALAEGLITQPVQFGAGFVRPSKRLVRLARAERGPRMLTPEQCQTLIDDASDVMRAFIYLGLNGGFTSRDCGTLPRKVVDLKAGIIAYARPKTGVARRVPLWSETIDALKVAMQTDGDLAFLTRDGAPYAKSGVGNDPIGLTFRRLLVKHELQRPGLGFATLRHIFQTIGEGSGDLVAVRAIMGHVDPSISEAYREGVSDERLRNVTAVVQAWLFAGKRKSRRPARSRSHPKTTSGLHRYLGIARS